jgi:flagellar capping protein FliD
MRECRAETERAYGEIVEGISARIRLEGDAEYREFVSKINSFVDKYNDTVAQREGRAKAKKKDEG